MDTTITLDEAHFKTLVAKARALGKTPEQYLQALIEADCRTFDEILAPARKGFESMGDDDIDELFERARKSAGKTE